MKTLTLALTSALLLLAFPIAVASEPDNCPATTELQYLEHPLDEGRYLFLDVTTPQKLGEWVEQNGVPGLQTEKCFRTGIFRYLADEQLAVLP